MNTLKSLLLLKTHHKNSIAIYNSKLTTLKQSLLSIEDEIWRNFTFPSIEAAKVVLATEHEAKSIKDVIMSNLKDSYKSDFVVAKSDKILSLVSYPINQDATGKLYFAHQLTE